MKIVGCDLHTRYQQIAMLDKGTGELVERRLEHESGGAPAGLVPSFAPWFAANRGFSFITFPLCPPLTYNRSPNQLTSPTRL